MKWILFRRLLFLFSHFIRYKGFSSFKPTLVSLKTPERILPWQVNQSNILGTVKYRGKKRRMCISVLISQWARNKTYTQQICNVLIIYKIWKLSFNSCCFFARTFFSKWKIILWLCVFCVWLSSAFKVYLNSTTKCSDSTDLQMHVIRSY